MQAQRRNLNAARLVRAWRADERGTQLVELALVLPILLMLLGATAEFARFMYTYSTLTKATRAGARYAVSQPPGANATETKNLVVFGNTAGTGTPVVAGLDTAKVVITPRIAANGTTDTVTVQIDNFTYQPIFDIGRLSNRPSLSLAVNLGASSTMRQLVQ
ncbi:MAG TPA: TadE/TadG family type IV pilus assembly protein [Pyrinomonadaceae bacterium]|jgi:Flp pilus assembly protein TadG